MGTIRDRRRCNPTGPRLRHGDRDLAANSAAGALGVGGGDLRDGEAPLNHRLDLPFRHQGTDLLELVAPWA